MSHQDQDRASTWAIIVSVLRAATALVGLCTIAGFLARWWWPLELTSNFRLQYAWLLGAAAVGWLVLRHPREAGLAAIGALVNAAMVAPFYLEEPLAASTTAEARWYRAVTLNVDVDSHAHERVLRFIHDANPDVVLLVEPNSRWISALSSLADRYPHREVLAADYGFGMALYSRLPMESVQTVNIGSANRPSIVARLNVQGRPLVVIGAHPRAPMDPIQEGLRNSQLREMARFIAQQQIPVMLLGDLNITSWSPFFRDFVREAGLRDSRMGFGVQPSWPAFFRPLSIPIDHALVTRGIIVHDRRLGPPVGSDHLPVIVDFSLEVR